jgi:hypothetical protein
MKAQIAQAAAEAAKAPGYAFLSFWVLDIVTFILRTRISAESRLSHTEEGGLDVRVVGVFLSCLQGGFDQNKISGMGTNFGLLVNVLPGPNKRRVH